MSEMSVTPSLTSALMPASAQTPGPAASADSTVGKTAAASAAASTVPGTDAQAAQGGDLSTFAAIMQRYLAQSPADAVPVAIFAQAPAAALPGAAPASIGNTLLPGSAAPPQIKPALAVADSTPLPVTVAASPVADPTPLQLATLAANYPMPLQQTALAASNPASVLANKTSLPVADPATAPVKRSAASDEAATDPTSASLAAAPAISQAMMANMVGLAEPSAATAKRPSATPQAAQFIDAALPTNIASVASSNVATAAATSAATATANDKAAITAALSAAAGEVAGGNAKRADAAPPEASFEGLLAAAQVAIQAHPRDTLASAPLHIETPVGANGWNDKVGQHLVWMVGNQEQRAELVLNPPQLGRVEVSVAIHGDQATAQFVSANPAVRDALEAALPRLREMMADAGINLGQAQVGSESANHAANQSANKQENRDNQSRASVGVGALRQMSSTVPWQRLGNGMVDVFA